MRLIEKIKGNEHFQILDEATSNSYYYHEIPEFPIISNEKLLIFCYLNNTFESIAFFLKALESCHVLALFSEKLADNLKMMLESNYNPNYIFDTSRPEILKYRQVDNNLFQKIENTLHNIHNDLKLLLSTSGTTGSPKLVKLSEKNLVSNAESIAAYLPISKTDIVPLNLPLQYAYGLSILTSNAIGGATVCVGSLDIISRGFWDNFQKYHYTTLAGVPYSYEMLDRIGFTKMYLPSLQYFTQAGGKLRDQLVRKFGKYAEEYGKLFYVMYGQTEATARMSYLEPSELLHHVGSIGKPISGGQFKINPDTSELIYMGANVFGGYAECLEDLTTFKSTGILNTGDLAKVDANGFYYITGRSKRIIKIYGNRINLDDLETVISKHFGDLYPCVGWQDKNILIFSTNEDCKKNEIIAWLTNEYKLHPTTFKVIITNLMPLTANGKIDYRSLISDYETT